MTRTKITIQVQSGAGMSDQMVIVGERQIKRWKIPTHQPLTLRFGSFRYPIRVVPGAHIDGIRLHESLAKRMGITAGLQMGIHYKSANRTLQIGPMIGIMMGRISGARPDQPFGESTPFCKEVVDACQSLGAFVYFFAISNIHGNSSSVHGWSYNRKWRKGNYPVPDVVYNRLMSRRYEARPNVQQFLREAKSRYGTVVFNEKYLNKNEVFEALRNESSVARYLPESHVMRGFQILQTMCNKYPLVFLKPITGSLGKGIIKISRTSGGYICHVSSLNGTVKRNFPNLVKLYAAFSGRLKAQRHQIQQGLQLVQARGRNVDFRALVQRNNQGVWAVTSIVARAAGKNHFVSNLARGGTLMTVKQALGSSKLPAAKQKQAAAQLQKAALDIAGGVEGNIKGHFAELGIDLAVDTNGRVWLLEVNSKPAKNDALPSSSVGKIRPSVKQMIQYCRYIAGF